MLELPPCKPLLIVISGPSGVGKDSVLNHMKARNLPFHFVVTTTTREPRPGEKNGVDYNFVSLAEFERMIDRGEFIEHALVYCQHKGVPKIQVDQALNCGIDVVMRLDVQGAETIKKLYPESFSIFLTARNEEDLVHRLQRREDAQSPEALEKRIATAKSELRCIPKFDYVVENRENELDRTVDFITAIILAEHMRVTRQKVSP